MINLGSDVLPKTLPWLIEPKIQAKVEDKDEHLAKGML